MNLFIENHTNQILSVDHKKIISDTIKCTLEFENINSNREINVCFVDNNKIKKMNKKFRSIDRKTDVLYFPMIEFNNKPKNFLIKKIFCLTIL